MALTQALGLAGIIIGGLGIGGIHDYGVTQAVRVPEIAIALIVAGSVLVFLSVAGMFGTIKNWRPLLIGFVVILLLITIAELGIGITAYTLADEQSVSQQLYKIWPKFTENVQNLIQINFVCCGRDGDPVDSKAPCSHTGIGHACIPPFSVWVTSRIEVLDIIAIVSAVVQIVIIIFAILLVKAISKRKDLDTVPLLSSHRVIHVH